MKTTHEFLKMIACKYAIMKAKDEIAEQLFSIEESAMLSIGVVNPEPDLLLNELHFPTVGKLMAA